MKTNTLCQIKNLSKHYTQGGIELEVIKNLSIDIPRGKMIGLVGASGSGKSTLLHLIGLLDTPTQGHITFENISYHQMSESERDQFRLTKLGFIFQFHHLLPDFTAAENIMMPLLLQRKPQNEITEHTHQILTTLGLANRSHHYPSQLSGGEQQRVAIARALIHRPTLLLADEPTGNLDEATAQTVLQSLRSLVVAQGCTAFIVTHDQELAHQFDMVYQLKNKALEVIST